MNQKKPNKALQEKKGIDQPGSTNIDAAKELRSKRKVEISTISTVEKIIQGNITALSQAITLIESSNTKHQKQASELIEKCLPHSGNSIKIGVTGVPGVGKSTFIETLGSHFVQKDRKVAILAVDPSSTYSKGSIMGDKTRMENLVKNRNVFIRPTPSGPSLGGVARKTRENIVLCEAAGFETIIIETVGVGQSEIAVHSMVDTFLLLKLAGAGDELQGIKRGIIEMADIIAINKADGDNINAARRAKQDFKNALHLYPPKSSGWQTQVFMCSALRDEGIDKIVKEIETYINHVKENNQFIKNRIDQQEYWLRQTIEDRLKSDFYQREEIKSELNLQLKKIREQKTTAYAAANYLLGL